MICLRVDLDYVPWDDSSDSSQPAIVLRLLELARQTGVKFHFFISTRSLRALPTSADAVLGEGHDLDWLCDEPTTGEYEKAKSLFALAGHKILGVATTRDEVDPSVEQIDPLRFISGPESLRLNKLALFPAIEYENLKPTDVQERQTVILQPHRLAQTDADLKKLQHFIQQLSNQSIAINSIRDWLKK